MEALRHEAAEQSTIVHPAAYLALAMPFGIVGGYVSVTLVYMATEANIPAADAAALASLAVLPQILGVLWAPIVDLTLTRKRWYMMACTTGALALAAGGALPVRRGAVGWLSLFILIAATASSFLAMALESIIAHATPEERRGTVGGWFQAGALAGMGLGGGGGLWLASHFGSPRLAAAVVALAMLACQTALRLVPEPPHTSRPSARAGLAEVAREVAALARLPKGRLAGLMCILPIGTGAASNLWAAIANDWQVSAGAVALVTGVASGIVSAVGALAGGPLSDRVDRRIAYLLVCGFMAAVTAVMAFAPRAPAVFVLGTLAYAFANGLIYAAFAALVLDTIGTGAAATKYNAYASLVYAPIFYMTRVDGWAYDRWGAAGLLWMETALGAAGIALVGSRLFARRREVIPAG